jgi:hypothetical protein
MNLFWALVRIVTALACFESSHRFKTLRLCTKIARWLAKRQVVFAGKRAESFSLRETGLDVSLRSFAAPTALETSAD